MMSTLTLKCWRSDWNDFLGLKLVVKSNKLDLDYCIVPLIENDVLIFGSYRINCPDAWNDCFPCWLCPVLQIIGPLLWKNLSSDIYVFLFAGLSIYLSICRRKIHDIQIWLCDLIKSKLWRHKLHPIPWCHKTKSSEEGVDMSSMSVDTAYLQLFRVIDHYLKAYFITFYASSCCTVPLSRSGPI